MKDYILFLSLTCRKLLHIRAPLAVIYKTKDLVEFCERVTFLKEAVAVLSFRNIFNSTKCKAISSRLIHSLMEVEFPFNFTMIKKSKILMYHNNRLIKTCFQRNRHFRKIKMFL